MEAPKVSTPTTPAPPKLSLSEKILHHIAINIIVLFYWAYVTAQETKKILVLTVLKIIAWTWFPAVGAITPCGSL